MSGKEKELELIPEHQPQDLVVDVPKPNEKGYLKRQHEIVQFMHAFESAERTGVYDADMIPKLIDFLIGFISKPVDGKEAEALLWELSEEEFKYVMAAIQGVGLEAVPPTKDSP